MKNEMNIRCIMSKDILPVTGAEQAVYALVEIKAPAAPLLGSMPANFGLVLDRSGSMDGPKMEHLKEAVGYVVDHLADSDLLSVTIFDDQVETLVPNQPAKDRAGIKKKLGAVIPRGGTQISDGLKAGLEEVRKGFARDRVNRVLLLTDGQTWDDENACMAMADEAGREGIAVTSIGIGEDWNEKLLLQIAERSRGNSHWIQNPIAILDAFRQEVEGIQSVAATNLRLSAKLSPGVRAMKIYTTIPMIVDLSSRAVQNGTANADLGSLDGNKGQAVLIELRVPPQQAGRFSLGRVELSYDLAGGNGTAGRTSADLAVDFNADAAKAVRVNAQVMNLVEKLSAFKLQTRALTDVEKGDLEAATRRLQSAATVLLTLGEQDLADAATREVQALKRTGALTAAGTKKLEYGTRKLTQVLTKTIK